jgi:hypothetical protein
MFWGCKLNETSVTNILNSIRNVSSGYLSLGVGCNNNETDKNLFAQQCGFSNMNELLQQFKNKGWDKTAASYNGRPTNYNNTAASYSLRRPTEPTENTEDTLPVFVKVEEITDENQLKDANYVSEDDSKHYILRWHHETVIPFPDYTEFSSIEDAIKSFNIKPIENNL